MRFTTHFGLHSQATRLLVGVSCSGRGGVGQVRDCHPLWYPVPRNLDPQGTPATENATTNYNSRSHLKLPDSKFELFPLHSPLLGESWLVSFPPLTDMLKFSGLSCLIWDHNKYFFFFFVATRPAGEPPTTFPSKERKKKIKKKERDDYRAPFFLFFFFLEKKGGGTQNSSLVLKGRTKRERRKEEEEKKKERIFFFFFFFFFPFSFVCVQPHNHRIFFLFLFFNKNKNKKREGRRGVLMMLRQACPQEKKVLEAQYAFKVLMIHGILQFTLLIALRCVLHRCESQEIRC